MRNCYPQCTIQRLFIIVILLWLNTSFSLAQETITPLIVGSSISQSINSETNNGILTAGLNFVMARRTYELAVIINDNMSVNGAEFVHKIFLNRKTGNDEYNIQNYLFRPFLVYNLVYKREISETQLENNLILNGTDYYSISNLEQPEKVTTIEHYIGLGVEKDLFQHMYINTSAFTGIHLGMNNNNNKIDSSKDQHQENAYSWNVKFGFGYRF